MKTLLASFGLTLVKHFLSFLFGGLPPVEDAEQFRLWCLKNHRYLALIAAKTTAQWDDQFAAMLLHLLESPVSFRTVWSIITGNLTETVSVIPNRQQRFIERFIGVIVNGTKTLK